MRRIDLAKDEENKYEVIKELVEKNGNKNRAAKKLCCTRRSIDRYIKGYKTYGKEFLCMAIEGANLHMHLLMRLRSQLLIFTGLNTTMQLTSTSRSSSGI